MDNDKKKALKLFFWTLKHTGNLSSYLYNLMFNCFEWLPIDGFFKRHQPIDWVDCAFDWEKTNEGDAYWHSVHEMWADLYNKKHKNNEC